MELKPRLQQQLATVRGITDAYLAAFQTPEQWTMQVHDQANHALWFAGHLGTVDDFLIRALSPEKSNVPDGYREKFGMGSRPTSNPADYPDAEEVVAYMRERRQVLLDVLSGLGEDDLTRPSPEGIPEFMPDVGGMFEAAAWHEAMHAGQVSVARRAMGNPPLVDAPPAEPS